MKTIGAILLLMFFLFLLWNTRIALPTSDEAVGIDLWALVMFALTCGAGRVCWRVFKRQS